MAEGKTKGAAKALETGGDPLDELEERVLAWARAFLLGDASLDVAPLAGGGWSVKLSKLPAA